MVCARCSGLYLSFLFSFLLLWRVLKKYQPEKDFFLALILVFPLAFDGAFSYLGWWQTNNQLRWVTGVLAGFSFALLLLPFRLKNSDFQTNSSYLLERLKVLGGVTVLLLTLRLSGEYYLENLLITLGILLLFFLINFAWVNFFLKKRKQGLVAFLFASALTIGELALLSYLHIF